MNPHFETARPTQTQKGPMAGMGTVTEGLISFLRGALGHCECAPRQARFLSKGQQRLSAQELYLRQLQQRYSSVTRCC